MLGNHKCDQYEKYIPKTIKYVLENMFYKNEKVF